MLTNCMFNIYRRTKNLYIRCLSKLIHFVVFFFNLSIHRNEFWIYRVWVLEHENESSTLKYLPRQMELNIVILMLFVPILVFLFSLLFSPPFNLLCAVFFFLLLKQEMLWSGSTKNDSIFTCSNKQMAKGLPNHFYSMFSLYGEFFSRESQLFIPFCSFFCNYYFGSHYIMHRSIDIQFFSYIFASS